MEIQKEEIQMELFVEKTSENIPFQTILEQWPMPLSGKNEFTAIIPENNNSVVNP